MIKKVEVLANVAVIVASILLSSVLVKKYFFPRAQTLGATSLAPQSESPFVPARTKRAIKPGTKIDLPGLNWSKSNQTLLLALSTTCRFCTESAPFYQQLEQKKSKDVQVIAVFPQPVDDATKYLNKLGVSTHGVLQAPLATVGVSGTPTLVLLDNTGVVKASWVGKLSADGTKSVFERIGQAQ